MLDMSSSYCNVYLYVILCKGRSMKQLYNKGNYTSSARKCAHTAQQEVSDDIILVLINCLSYKGIATLINTLNACVCASVHVYV